jgi:hypothetical protein
MRPRTLSEAYRRMIDGPRAEHAFDEFLDTFYNLRTSTDRFSALLDEPPLTNDPVDNAVAAAAAEYLCNQYDVRDVPVWVFDPRRSRNLFTEERPLKRARQPAADEALLHSERVRNKAA